MILQARTHLLPSVIPSWAAGWGVEVFDTHDGKEQEQLFVDLDLGGEKLRLHWIPPGEFTMGSEPAESAQGKDETLHTVHLSNGFWLGKYSVTQSEYETIVGNNPSDFAQSKSKQSDRERLPVESLDWQQAVAFCEKLNEKWFDGETKNSLCRLRLPTEAEWEYACRAGTDSAFNDGSACSAPSGLDPALAKLGWHNEGANGTTHPVGKLAPNNWGLYDMHGNVWEWCLDQADWKDEVITDTYRDSIEDPVCRVGARRVVRGGSYWDHARFCRSAYRGAVEPVYRSGNLGFRLAAGPIAEPG